VSPVERKDLGVGTPSSQFAAYREITLAFAVSVYNSYRGSLQNTQHRTDELVTSRSGGSINAAYTLSRQ